jgi:modification methylase
MVVPVAATKAESLSAEIYNHSSESMDEIDADSVALTVTSPPYWNAIDYDRHSEDASNWYRTRKYAQGYAEYAEYLEWVQRIFAEVFAKTVPGGFCAVVIGTVLLNGKHYPVPMDFTGRMVDAGWEFHQDIIWHKCTAGVKRFGSFIQHPYPGYFYPNIMTEYVLIFRKPGERIYRGRSQQELNAGRQIVDALFTSEIANNVWHVAPVPPRSIEHPCPFPEELPFRLINLYSYAGDLVLDPFVGSGQTTKVAHQLGRRTVGYDTQMSYVEVARRRLGEPLSIRRKQLLAKFAKLDTLSGVVTEGSRGTGYRRTARPNVIEIEPRLSSDPSDHRDPSQT